MACSEILSFVLANNIFEQGKEWGLQERDFGKVQLT